MIVSWEEGSPPCHSRQKQLSLPLSLPHRHIHHPTVIPFLAVWTGQEGHRFNLLMTEFILERNLSTSVDVISSKTVPDDLMRKNPRWSQDIVFVISHVSVPLESSYEDICIFVCKETGKLPSALWHFPPISGMRFRIRIFHHLLTFGLLKCWKIHVYKRNVEGMVVAPWVCSHQKLIFSHPKIFY